MLYSQSVHCLIPHCPDQNAKAVATFAFVNSPGEQSLVVSDVLGSFSSDEVGLVLALVISPQHMSAFWSN